MKIYTLPDKAIDKIIIGYIDYVTNPYNFFRQTSAVQISELGETPIPYEKRALKYTYDEHYYVDHKEIPLIENLPKPNFENTKCHFISLIHQIYLRSLNFDDQDFYLSSQILNKVYGNSYSYMMDELCHQTILSKKQDHDFQFIYSINYPENFFFEETKNRKVIADLGKLSKVFKGLHIERLEEAKKATSNQFITRYNNNIRKLKFERDTGLEEFMKYNEFKSFQSKNHYKYIISKIKSGSIKEIEGCDKNGRFYHIGTQIPKKIKPFTNIKFSIDAKNSHPVLFNVFLLNFYIEKSIDINSKFNESNNLYFLLALFLSKFNYRDISNLHYFKKELCNHLKNSKIKSDISAKIVKIPKDVWLYMYRTSCGLLWDDFYTLLPQNSRNETKQLMFQDVFYSQSTRVLSDNKHGNAFKQLYPNVKKVINYYKKSFKAQCVVEQVKKNKKGRDGVQLPHMLMRLESAIFTEILTRLFKKRDLACFGIHDAVVVLNDTYTPEYIQEVMIKIYSGYGLVPTLDVDRHS